MFNPCRRAMVPGVLCALALLVLLGVPARAPGQRLTVSPLLQPTGVLIEWDYGSSGQDAFVVARCTATPLATGTCTPVTTLPLTLGASARSATDVTAKLGTRVCYSVGATSAITPASALTAPVCTDVLARPISAQLAWDYPTVGQTSFELLRCIGASCTPTTPLALSIPPDARVATDGTAVGGITYCYAIRALKAGDPSSPSPASTPTCVTVPAPGVATQLVYSVPPGTGTAGIPLAPVTVQVRDAYDALVHGATTAITLSLAGTTEAGIPNDGVSVAGVDSEHPNEEARLAIDVGAGVTTSTFWSTLYSLPMAPLPHWIILDLGHAYSVTGLKVQPPVYDSPDAAPGTPGQYAIDVSLDGVTWVLSVAAGVWPSSPAEKTVEWSARTARYVRLNLLTEVHGYQTTAIANLQVQQTASGSGGMTGTLTVNAVDGSATFTPTVTAGGTYVLVASATGVSAVQAPFLVNAPEAPAITNPAVLVRRVPR
jgi:hypothetical protein